jgi:hypothetical protein
VSIGLLKLGGLANHFVVSHNGGTMPVWVINEDMEDSLIGDDRHSPLVKSSQYKFLCDIFVIPELTPNGLEYMDIMSLGDLFLWVGRSLLCLSQIVFVGWVLFLIGQKGFSWIRSKISMEIGFRE